jgi:hypothetical protein
MRNFSQRRCRYCGSHGGDYGRHGGQCISPEELESLKAWIDQNGRTWRSKLRDAWTREEPVLRELRNKVGPSGLDVIRK